MKKHLIAVILIATTAVATPSNNHEAAAAELIDLTGGHDMFKLAFTVLLDPMLADLQQKGAPQEMIADIKAVFLEWVDQEIKWEELRPRLVALYITQLSESEISEILAFHRTATGKKLLAVTPLLFKEGAQIGHTYSAEKEPMLMERLQRVLLKYNPPE